MVHKWHRLLSKVHRLVVQNRNLLAENLKLKKALRHVRDSAVVALARSKNAS